MRRLVRDSLNDPVELMLNLRALEHGMRMMVGCLSWSPIAVAELLHIVRTFQMSDDKRDAFIYRLTYFHTNSGRSLNQQNVVEMMDESIPGEEA